MRSRGTAHRDGTGKSLHLLRDIGLAALFLFLLKAAGWGQLPQAPPEITAEQTQATAETPTPDPDPAHPNPAVTTPECRVGTKLSRHVNPKYDVSRIGNRDVAKGVNFYSLEREHEMGHELAIQVEQSSKLIRDPVLNEYVNRVGQNIVRHSDAKVPFTIKIIDSDEINAFALPGGYFYVNSGLILAADNEAELAGVMAHEIAHVAARHATRNQTRGQIFDIATIPLIFIGGPVVMAAQQISQLAVPMTFLKFSRDAEREADLLGIEYEYAAGYDPAAFVQFFEKMKATEKQQKKAGFFSKAFATHPMTDDRVRQAQKEIQEFLPAREDYMVDNSEFQEIKTRLALIERIPKGADPTKPILRREGNRRADSSVPGDDSGRPTLKRAPGSDTDNGGTTTASNSGTGTTDRSGEDPDRPTLHRTPPADSGTTTASTDPLPGGPLPGETPNSAPSGNSPPGAMGGNAGGESSGANSGSGSGSATQTASPDDGNAPVLRKPQQ
jgi:hypothetical protein